jgi:hypothetical protein
MKKKLNKKYPKIFEFRIKYNADDFAQDSYHYYSAINAEEALKFHSAIAQKRGYSTEVISIEKKNPYSNSWEACSETAKENEHE